MHQTAAATTALAASTTTTTTDLLLNPFLNKSIKLEIQEKVIRTALKAANHYSNADETATNFLFHASPYIDSDNCSLTLVVDKLDKSNVPLVSGHLPVSNIENVILVPVTICCGKQQQPQPYGSDLKFIRAHQSELLLDITNPANFYLNAIKQLELFLRDPFSNFGSIVKALTLNSAIVYYGNDHHHQSSSSSSTNLTLSLDLVTLSNLFTAQRIQPITLIETGLLKVLQNDSKFYMKPNAGYCTLHESNKIALATDKDSSINKRLNIVGM